MEINTLIYLGLFLAVVILAVQAVIIKIIIDSNRGIDNRVINIIDNITNSNITVLRSTSQILNANKDMISTIGNIESTINHQYSDKIELKSAEKLSVSIRS